MKKQKNNSLKKGFTLIEVMMVMAIIGIMAGVVMVSMKSSVDRSKKSSALTTASSVLPEIVTCQDDGGNINRPSSSSTGGGTICSAAGHNAAWPNISQTGWVYSAAGGGTWVSNANIVTMTFNLTKNGETAITCSFASNGCN